MIPATMNYRNGHGGVRLLDLLLLGEGLSGVLLLAWGFIVFLPQTDALTGASRYTVLLDLFGWASDPELPVGLIGMFGGLAMSTALLVRHGRHRFHERWIGRAACCLVWLTLAVPMLLAAPHVVGGWLALIAALAHVAAARKERVSTAEV